MGELVHWGDCYSYSEVEGVVSHGSGHQDVCVMDAEGDDEGMGVLDNVVRMGNTEVVCCLVLPEIQLD